MLCQGIEDSPLATGTRWVDHESVELRGQYRQQVFYFALEDVYIADLAQVPLGIFDGAGRLFDGDDPLDMASQQEGEGSYSAVGVGNGEWRNLAPARGDEQSF